jgi:hypothetical protein
MEYFPLINDGDQFALIVVNGRLQMLGLNSKRINEIELLQFTGLRDKYGNEIWEGDIVKDIVDGAIVEVKWINDGIAGFMPWADMIVFAGRPSFIYPDKEVEVIGNIHENPDMLEKVA